jgi:hypothetical protein
MTAPFEFFVSDTKSTRVVKVIVSEIEIERNSDIRALLGQKVTNALYMLNSNPSTEGIGE